MSVLDYDLDFSQDIIKPKTMSCKCPMCEDIYKRRMKWSGNGMPRKLCEKCKNSIKKSQPGMEIVTL